MSVCVCVCVCVCVVCVCVSPSLLASSVIRIPQGYFILKGSDEIFFRHQPRKK